MAKKSVQRNDSTALNFLTLVVLFFSFSITVLSQQSASQVVKDIAYAYLVGAFLFAIMAILPKTLTNFFRNKYAIVISYSTANLAWLIVFAMKWLDGIKNTNNVEGILVSLVGILFLFAIVLIETRYLKKVTKWRHFGLMMPIAIVIYRVFNMGGGFDWLVDVILLLFVVGSLCVIYTKWEPGGDLPFLPSP